MNNIQGVLKEFNLCHIYSILEQDSNNKMKKSLSLSILCDNKTTYWILLLLILVLSYSQLSQQQCLTADDSTYQTGVTVPELYKGQQEFSLKLLHAINQQSPNKNVFFSPYSTYHALLIAYFMAGNQTENRLKKVLQLDQGQSKVDIYYAYKFDKMVNARRQNDPNSSRTFDLNIANKVYVADQVQVRPCISTKFSDEYESLNFKKDAESAREHINEWVDQSTHHMIQNLLPQGSIDGSTNLVLVNAAYFKGLWQNKFDSKQTKLEIFYVNSTKQILIDMMYVEGTFNHDVSESLKAHILEMPYQGSDISMFVLLPPFTNEGNIDYTLKHLTLEAFQNLVDDNSLFPRTVKVTFPKFTLEHTIELVPTLENLGIGDVFRKSADFSTLSETSNITIGSALHKARIQVNEEGTKAAAATVLFTFRSSRPSEPAQFICNHPFIYVIYNKLEKSILFSGVFRKPYL